MKIGAKNVRKGRSITFQMAKDKALQHLLQQILTALAALRPEPAALC